MIHSNLEICTIFNDFTDQIVSSNEKRVSVYGVGKILKNKSIYLAYYVMCLKVWKKLKFIWILIPRTTKVRLTGKYMFFVKYMFNHK